MDIRQPLLLLLAIAVPLLLFRLRRPDLVVGWIAITLTVHIFDTNLLTNLPAGRVVGLLYLPLALVRLQAWLRYRPVAAWVLNFGYLLLLGVIFGFLQPWPDVFGNRVWSTTAPGRAIVYPVRLLADLSLMLFLAEQLCKPGMILFFGRSFIMGASMTAAMGFANLILPGFDPYNLITGEGYSGGIAFDRARGLSFEPRGLGLACVYGLMILLVYPGAVTRRRNFLMVITMLGLLSTYSTSALAVAVVGILTVWSFLSNRMRWNIGRALIVIPAVICLVAVTVPTQFQHGVNSISERTSTDRLQGAVARSLIEQVAWRLDVFDASSILFLGTHPQYILTGTGPGEIMLAASSSLPPGVYSLVFAQSGLNGVPSLGLLLEICNSGLAGAFLWIVQVAYCRRALSRLARAPSSLEGGDRSEEGTNRSEEWKFGFALFSIGAAIYLFQNSLEQPYWQSLLAVGWAAARTASEQQRQTVPSEPARIHPQPA